MSGPMNTTAVFDLLYSLGLLSLACIVSSWWVRLHDRVTGRSILDGDFATMPTEGDNE